MVSIPRILHIFAAAQDKSECSAELHIVKYPNFRVITSHYGLMMEFFSWLHIQQFCSFYMPTIWNRWNEWRKKWIEQVQQTATMISLSKIICSWLLVSNCRKIASFFMLSSSFLHFHLWAYVVWTRFLLSFINILDSCDEAKNKTGKLLLHRYNRQWGRFDANKTWLN